MIDEARCSESLGETRLGGFKAGIAMAAAIAGMASVAIQAAPRGQSTPTPPAPACAKALPRIQQCIAAAALSSAKAKDMATLTAVADQLRSGMATDRGPSLHYRTYWLAYADYLAATLALGEKRLDRVAALTSEADTLLDKLAVKDDESYALQDLVLLVRFAVAQPAEIETLVSRTADLRAKLAKSGSVRALYALALADHYTPKQYGGGRVAESLLRQALAAREDAASPLKPTWGRDDCAALLIQILRQAGSNDEANTLYAQWRQRYPDSFALAQLAKTS